ncbi:hypothetical protein HJG54_34235 [Leptolyngbya sp. NK1-12]|uniref:Uncharacterized protein n=1 Tax=Leptolyngbya sp. NK1-12 TaxID=2547451 RepID=A0AA97AJK0_9CYAN|nr:hypothetical protein [Leptolyngbya sp. NK1-12]WNZ26902.1 hypothetical protein HJG54_28665 [Leptolyngbya sp. NK1-12]WNZ27885.1 hypothetical protein HJG54_34235 [Leptolyngbya sp. NK1-12]
MNHYELIWNFLREFFDHEHYVIAVERARKAISTETMYQQNWFKVMTTIQSRSLLPDQPLKLVHEAANKILDDNTDDEAYVWLDKMVYNVERTDGKIEEY